MFVLSSVSIFSLVDNVAKHEDLIHTNGGNRPQLVHWQRRIQQPSGFVRFATRLGLANGNKPILEAAEKAHRFITSNYKPGDQVTLVVTTAAKWETNYQAKATEMLAWHLYNGTSPSNRSKTQIGAGVNTGRIPIHAVVAYVVSDEKQSLSSWSDGWKPRLNRTTTGDRHAGGVHSNLQFAKPIQEVVCGSVGRMTGYGIRNCDPLGWVYTQNDGLCRAVEIWFFR
ncbi:unnamed protein product [Rhizoctonia solani]|uniref:Uncharacterized protein n=1 Tax=Rhizoctonia solani TaxID=456999 RepID=A0A8H3HW63_9AGAM|nr:unnamed protein product [Rhizoctonia solani]